MVIKPGSVIAFHYLNHDPPKTRIGRVQVVRDIKNEPLSDTTLKRHPDLIRSRYLLTMKMADGTYRAFYHCGLDRIQGNKLASELMPLLLELLNEPDNGRGVKFVPGSLSEDNNEG